MPLTLPVLAISGYKNENTLSSCQNRKRKILLSSIIYFLEFIQKSYYFSYWLHFYIFLTGYSCSEYRNYRISTHYKYYDTIRCRFRQHFLCNLMLHSKVFDKPSSLTPARRLTKKFVLTLIFTQCEAKMFIYKTH